MTLHSRTVILVLMIVPACGGRDESNPPVPGTCDSTSPATLARCVDESRYRADLTFVAMERVPESVHWQAVQDRCRDVFIESGFEVELHDYGSGVNVVGARTGTTEGDRLVVVAAHYDHIRGCDGADDNASGTAGVLEVARVLGTREFPRTLVVACWDEEELGLVGSQAWVARTTAAGATIDVNYNFEMIAFVDATPDSQAFPPGFDLVFPDAAAELEARDHRGDFIALVGDETASVEIGLLGSYAQMFTLPTIAVTVPTSLTTSPALADLRRSDHAPFWLTGNSAIMLTDTANFRYDGYHCGGRPDVIANLDITFATNVVRTTVAAAAVSLGLPE